LPCYPFLFSISMPYLYIDVFWSFLALLIIDANFSRIAQDQNWSY
jgi:hypothetical protein